MYSWTPWIIFGGIALLSYAVQANLKRKFATYSKVMLRSGMSGRDVAVAMLRDENVHGVEVVSTQGHLTDHYDPSSGTIRLSESVFQSATLRLLQWQPMNAGTLCSTLGRTPRSPCAPR